MRHPSSPGSGWTRRDVLLASAAAIVVAACGDDGDGTGSDDGTAEPLDDITYELVAGFPRNEPYVVAGITQRLPFLIAVQADAPVDEIDGTVPFEVADADGNVVATAAVEPHSEGLPRAYLPLEATLATPGIHTATATYRGQRLETPFAVSAPDEVSMVQVGAALPAVATPTVADAAGVDPICTREPECPFHEVDLATAAANGKPTVLLIGTPLYCQTAICGPVLELMIEDLAGRDDLNVIHAEVYANPEQVDTILEATAAPVVDAFGLPFEPVLYGADASGTIVDRLDLIWDRREMKELVVATGG